MNPPELHYWPATELAAAIRRRDISSTEVVQAHLDRIEEVNPKLNCIVAQIPASQALDAAHRADQAIIRGEDIGVLHGLPTAVKDLLDVEGIPTKYGSVAFADANPAARDSLLVKRVRSAGGIVIGKTNTPEFGVGTLTFNEVYGTTRNPWDLKRHAGGSSAAAAGVAAGLLPLADGSDSGGSLRFPSSFCNTVGLRPTPGLIPSDGTGSAWSPHSVLGPMARNSQDAALYTAAVTGVSNMAPLSIDSEASDFLKVRPGTLDGVRIAWSADAGGLPVDPEIRGELSGVRAQLEAAGARVSDAAIDFTDVDEAWEIVEMFGFFSRGWRGVESNPELYRSDFVRNVIQGGQLNAKQIARGFGLRTEIFRRTSRLLSDFDVIVTPATPVTAPLADLRWVDEIDGHAFERYFEWQRMATRITMTGHPALVTPAGFTKSDKPFGLQIVGPPREDASLLSLGATIEDLLKHTQRHPDGI